MARKLACSPRNTNRSSGFALVIAFTLISFFLLIVMALMSVSRTESKTAEAYSAETEARQNAITAAKMALGQLQQLSGADTRVTASSKVLDPNNVPLTGVWRSWEASDRNSSNSGKPIAPDYTAKTRAGDASKAVQSSSGHGRFLGWLTSLEAPNTDPLPGDASGVLSGDRLSNDPATGLVPMVANGSVDSMNRPQESVYILPTPIMQNDDTTGSFAWWTSGDNAKAYINIDPDPAPPSPSTDELQKLARSNGRPDPSAFGLGWIDDSLATPQFASASMLNIDYDSTSDRDGTPKNFHDLTAYNRGLLTNTAVGGWRKDLSLMTESFVSTSGDSGLHSTLNPLPSNDLPFYTSKPGTTIGYRKSTGSLSSAPHGLVYPWANYRNAEGGPPNRYGGPITSWNHLVDYTLSYRDVEFFGGIPEYTLISNSRWPRGDQNEFKTDEARYAWADQMRVSPVVARFQLTFGISAEEEMEDEKDSNGEKTGNQIPTGKYVPTITLNPAFTLWNPYNVKITVPADQRLSFKLRKSGASGKFHFNTIPPDPSKAFSKTMNQLFNNQLRFMTPNENLVLLPGETKIFGLDPSAAPIVSGNTSNTQVVELIEGYSAGSAWSFNTKANSTFELNETIVLEKFTFDDPIKTDGGEAGLGMMVHITSGENKRHATSYYFMQLVEDNLDGGSLPEDDSDKYFRALSAINIGDTVSNLIPNAANPHGTTMPAIVMTFANRYASPPYLSDQPASKNNIPALQGHPLVNHMNIGESDMAGTDPEGAGTGNYHPINSPFDLFLNEYDPTYPVQWDNSNNSSYIITGENASNGLTRAIVAEVPTNPLQSLVDLTHWDAREVNPVPPFQFNLLGNASASPIIPQDAVGVPGNPGSEFEDFCNDDSYLLNHLFFDDWFVSSIAPQTTTRGSTSSYRDSLKDTYRNHLTGTQSLPNRFYKPTSQAQSLGIDSAVDEIVNGGKTNLSGGLSKYPYEYIASRMEVMGMFNINSTSVSAWEALLRQARDQQIAYIDLNGAVQTDTPTTNTTPFPRTSLAGDQSAGSSSYLSSTSFSGATEFTGYRALSDTEIYDLALEIVSIIQTRGPFLSLSEFVNRQLSNVTDDAIAGTIQKALDNLARGKHSAGSSNSDPFNNIKASSFWVDNSTSNIPGVYEDYAFPEAAEGDKSFGLPGWTRQADILRPIAPILSARDDTFTIRAYGDKRDPSDSSRILAKAWCQLVVKRTAKFLEDDIDAPEALPFSADEMTSTINEVMGRRYEIVSFRWLNEEEI
ncbi:MAG: hypothetical protein ACPGN3_13485 [Opitutales bacterium]